MVKTESIEVSDLVLLGGEAESPFFWGKKPMLKDWREVGLGKSSNNSFHPYRST